MEDKPLNLDQMTITQSPTEFAFWNGISREDTSVFAHEKLGYCYEFILNKISSYMDMNDDDLKKAVLYLISIHFHDKFKSFPMLFINAMRGSGKTRLLELMSTFTKARGDYQVGITESILFRTPKGFPIFLDECESLNGKDKAIFREYLNASYKAGATVKRTIKKKTSEGEGYGIEHFEPYKPIILANIFGLEEVLSDRSITIILEKSSNPAKIKKQNDFRDDSAVHEIRRTLEKISVVMSCRYVSGDVNKYWNMYIDTKYTHNDIYTYTTLTTLNDIMTLEFDEFFREIDDSGIDGRNLELWFPLLCVAREISEAVFLDILRIAKKSVSAKKDDEFTESKDVSLYDFIVTLDQALGMSFISLKELTNRFRMFLGETDAEDKWLNDKWVGRALKRLNLTIDKKRMASGRFVTLNYIKAHEKLKMFKSEEKQ